jgi:3-hydroxymyristoyl/3-hydroxydecanoyl-(acyl carrier protein) dehydratase
MPTPPAVAADHPALPGHFPGHPVVPGVVILDCLVADLAARTGARAVGVRRMKFTRPLAPGEEFSVEWAEAQKGGVRFSVKVGAEMLASGQLLLG